jgi:hypothetical protein
MKVARIALSLCFLLLVTNSALAPAILNTRIIQFADDKEKPCVGIRLPWS